MKKSYLKVFSALFAVAVATTNMAAQETNQGLTPSAAKLVTTTSGLYVSLNGGYGFNAATETSGTNSTITTDNYKTTTTAEAVNSSFGKGLNLGGVVGYMFNKNIGAELGVNYLLGAKTEFKDVTVITNTFTTINITENVSATMLRIMPTLILATGMEKFNPYAKFGVVVGTGSIIDERNSTSTSNPYTSSSITTGANTSKVNGGIAFGYTASVGVIYSITEKLSLFGELNLISMSYAPTRGEITESSTNGVSDNLNLINHRYADFVDKVTIDESVTTPFYARSQILKRNHQFSSFGVNVGVKYSF